LLLRASGPETEKKHGTPAASVAGVYSFMGLRNFALIPVIASVAKQFSRGWIAAALRASQ